MLNQRYQLRSFRRDDPAEIERINLMYYHPEVAKAKGYHGRGFGIAKSDDLQQRATLGNEQKERSRRNMSYAVADQGGRLVGWVWFYQDRRYPMPIRVQRKLDLVGQKCQIYQVSYEKLLSVGWPSKLVDKVVYTPVSELYAERPGVIVEGLGLALTKLKADIGKRRRVGIYAYVLPSNVASKKVLAANGFICEDRRYRYDRVLHELWVRVL